MVLVTQRPTLIGATGQHPEIDQAIEPLRQNVGSDPEVLGKMVKASSAHEALADDK